MFSYMLSPLLLLMSETVWNLQLEGVSRPSASARYKQNREPLVKNMLHSALLVVKTLQGTFNAGLT